MKPHIDYRLAIAVIGGTLIVTGIVMRRLGPIAIGCGLALLLFILNHLQ